MRIARYFLLPVVAAVIGFAVFVLFGQHPKTAPPVSVLYRGATNDASGAMVHIFEVTNATQTPIYGSHAVEVFHNGVWFNALPQPKSSPDLTTLQAHHLLDFKLPVPVGRAEAGLRVQTDPPGEKWRVYFSYVASSEPAHIRETLARWLGTKNTSKQYYVFSPEVPFSSRLPTLDGTAVAQ